MPLASMSNDLDLGTPRGAGGRSTSWNLPSVLLYIAISRSPWSTWISTEGCMSSAVVNTSVRRVGMVVLRSMSLVITPPLASMPRTAGHAQQDVLDLALEHTGLDGGTDGDHLVRVDTLVGVLVGQAPHHLGHRRHAGGAADEDDVLDVALRDAGVLDGLVERQLAAPEQVGRHLLELRA